MKHLNINQQAKLEKQVDANLPTEITEYDLLMIAPIENGEFDDTCMNCSVQIGKENLFTILNDAGEISEICEDCKDTYCWDCMINPKYCRNSDCK